MCFAAGNGQGQECKPLNPNYYVYPASYDHVFSTTSIGWKNPKGGSTINNIIGMHELDLGDPNSTYNHNSRIDICAPTFLGAFRYVPSDPTYLYYTFASGTSSSSPIVAGTAGLIQSAVKKFKGASVNFSPYQLEWILKKSALTDLFSYPENAPYLGKLGAGRLDAYGASILGASHNVNDPLTQTMYIKGIEINTICAPGFSSNGAKPKLTPIIVNGTPPYQYVWEQVPGLNYATLDNENIAEPTVIGITAPYTLYYRLTVYDNSPTAQKVAMKTFKVQLKTSGYDLAMRDSYVDMLNEPNDQRIFDPREWDTWTSPDVWNRQAADGGLEHQNPEYFVSDPNHMYTRVRNVGCASSPADSKLRLYWTKASTGENWDADWKYTDVCGIGSLQPGGREITTGTGISLPVLQPGDATIIHQNWYPNKPELYCGTPSTFEVCFLARIEEASGMTIPEKFTYTTGYAGVGENIRNNNNIVTRNTILTNLRPDNLKTAKRQLIVSNGNATATTYNFEFASERSIFRHFAGDFSSLGSVTLHLGSLYDAWVASGSHGTVASQNSQNRTVTFDGANTLRLDSIPFTANQRYTIDVEFAIDSPVVVNEVSNHIFHARQFNVTNPDVVYGAVNYQVTVSPSTQNNYRKTLIDSTSTGVIESFKVSPNPTSGIVHITYTGDTENNTELVVTDMVGKKIISESIIFSRGSAKDINLSQFASGIYLINIINREGKTEVYKVTKE
ncbi:MAG: T9SS type A sorting domain-containing protein [Phycisphaerales bacterium]|nr:T9SS type A sorting domain-containing protein [Phycisphaerales bacterium]